MADFVDTIGRICRINTRSRPSFPPAVPLRSLRFHNLSQNFQRPHYFRGSFFLPLNRNIRYFPSVCFLFLGRVPIGGNRENNINFDDTTIIRLLKYSSSMNFSFTESSYEMLFPVWWNLSLAGLLFYRSARLGLAFFRSLWENRSTFKKKSGHFLLLFVEINRFTS